MARSQTRISKMLRRTAEETIAVVSVRTADQFMIEVSHNEGANGKAWSPGTEGANMNGCVPLSRAQYEPPSTLGDMILHAIQDIDNRTAFSVERHVKRMEALVRGKWKHYGLQGEAFQEQNGNKRRNFIINGIRQYLTAASFPVFKHEAMSHFAEEKVNWGRPPLENDEDSRPRGQDGLLLFERHREIILIESRCIRSAAETLRKASNDINPLRIILSDELPRSENPNLALLKGRASQETATQVQHALDQLGRDAAGMAQMRGMLRHHLLYDDLEGRAGGQWPRPFVAQTTGQCSQDEPEAGPRAYLSALALMVYFSRQTIQVCTLALEAWAPTCNRNLSEKEQALVWKQSVFVSKALSNAQSVWHQLLKAPWSLACCLHFFAATSIAPAGSPSIGDEALQQERLQSQNQERPRRSGTQIEFGHSLPIDIPGAICASVVHSQDSVTVPNSDDDDEGEGGEPDSEDEDEQGPDFPVPEHVHPVLNALSDAPVKQMIEQSFRLGSITRRQHEAEADIRHVLESITPSGDPSASFSMEFVRNQPIHNEHDYGEEEIISLVKEYWECSSASERLDEGFQILSAIAKTDAFREGQIGLSLDPPQTHAETILVQGSYSKHRKCLPPIGVSHMACGTCSLFTIHMISLFNQSPRPPLEKIILGTRSGAFWPCCVPGGTPEEVVRKLAEDLRGAITKKLRDGKVLRHLRKHRVPAQQCETSSSRGRPRTLGSNEMDSDARSSPPDISDQMARP